MSLLLICLFAAMCCGLLAFWTQRRNDERDLESHSITPETLHSLMSAHPGVLLFDVRRPLDLLARLEIIPGATRIDPNELYENPFLIPRDKDTVVYCTCPGDESLRRVVKHALRLGFSRIKLLRGGLQEWKAKGYSVVPYDTPFHLDVRR